MGPTDVRALRERAGLSQATLACCLNVSTVLVQAWEAGRRVPQGAALRLLTLARRHPDLVFAGAEPSGATPPTSRRTKATEPHMAVAERPHDFDALLIRLADHGVHFVVIGGVAAQLRGAGLTTEDLDIIYERSPENLARLATALRGINPTLRGVPGAIPFSSDPRTLAHTSFLALDSRLGPIDLRQRLAGIGDYATARHASSAVEIAGRPVPTLTIDALIASKRTTARHQDRDQIAMLEAIR